ncbi:DUF1275 domain-containing protein [Rhizobiaceae bacterium n13]|uniref:DUF1275 domain-containing protein n=1 Tax=Ferirhizobium litorale TaxID=2927786 RepID=A0AAE3QBG4_9HYPH|nr:YoaK family protein [Fererhizobium litorale]MDI7860405.1 DUF1275 domain-containing protein [Fererhizobium litorale]MDI7920540.1 DUF1275 domain-containing protein [Fererhizobium litorale]
MSISFAFLATMLAGFLDAVGFQQLNHLYVSFMSGNSTHLGMALAAGEWVAAGQTSIVVGAFVAGAFVGTLLSDLAAKPIPRLLVVEVVFCAIAVALAAGGLPSLALTLIAVTMGMQNVMHRSIAGTDAGKSFVTGALFGLGQSLAHAVTRRGGLPPACVNAFSWISFVLGVSCGALSFTHWGVVSSLGIALAALISMLALALKASGMSAAERASGQEADPQGR